MDLIHLRIRWPLWQDETINAMNEIREGKTEKISFDELQKEAKKYLSSTKYNLKPYI